VVRDPLRVEGNQVTGDGAGHGCWDETTSEWVSR
jgi:hypothetical protein